MVDFSKNERILIGLYLIWFFIHTGLLTFTSEESLVANLFWPFNSGKESFVDTYDITEFLIYAGSPLVMYICYRLFFASETKMPPPKRKQLDIGFLPSLINEKIKVEELKQKISLLTKEPMSTSLLEELMLDKQKLEEKGVNRWIEKIEMKKKYKAFE
jgi:hypothetical protein